MERKEKQKKKERSLSLKTVRFAMLASLLLGGTALLTGLVTYRIDVFDQYTTNASNIAHYASLSAPGGASDAAKIAEEVMEIYQSLSPAEREQTGTEEYRARFADVAQGAEFQKLAGTLGEILAFSNVFDVYLGMYDRDTNALVYFVDPGEEYPMYPGDWESVPSGEIEKFLNWDAAGKLYDTSVTKRYGVMCTAGVPVTNDDGEVCAFFLVDVTMSNIRALVVKYSVQIFLELAVLIALVMLFLSKRMKKSIVEPINAIADAAAAYGRDKQDGISGENHFGSLKIETHDELENLADTMAGMERDLAEYEKNITRITAEKERIRVEMDMATRIQASVLPNIFPAYPEREEFDLYAVMDPAREVGGDFYDFLLLDDDHICMVIADVSGKGVPAALFMMTAKVILQSYASSGMPVDEILAGTNETLSANNPVEMFVTAWIGILQISTGRVTASNAGHEYPAIYDGSSFTLLQDRHGFVIGALEGVKYKSYEFTLKPGDKLFLYTDGVTEAANDREEMFGTDRMLRALNRRPEGTSEEVVREVRKEIDKFVGGAEQFDDITMLCLEYRG